MITDNIFQLIVFICLAIIFILQIIILLKNYRNSEAENILSNLQLILNNQQNILITINTTSDSQNKQASIIHTSFNQQLQSLLIAQQNQLETLYQQLMKISNLNETKLENMRNTLEDKLNHIQVDNNSKLEQMRATVEEKLHNTLEKRLGDSFKIVSERLEMVYKGLGEMKNLAAGVGDLKRVLSNVKTRGIWGEAQLDSIINQLMTSEQYAINVAVRPDSADRVEYAIKLPGQEIQSNIWLPIDAKFPLEDYQKLMDAQERADLPELERIGKLLEISIKKSAKTISEKYICPPYTTDFAIMFLPIEGLYAEVLRKPGLLEMLQRDFRVMITGPTTLSAILNSLQMGFKTLAIEKRSGEVWKLLDVIKLDFIKFSDLLSKTRVKLEQASQNISDAENRTKIIQRRLKSVDSEPELEIAIEEPNVKLI